MHIKALTIENFKGIRDPLRIDIKPVTLLFGPNSAGKSTILHAINYLNDIINHHDINADSTHLGQGALNLGGYRQFVHQHNTDNEINFVIDLLLEDEDLYETEAAGIYRTLFESRDQRNEKLRLFDLAVITSRIDSLQLSLTISWSESVLAPYVKKLTISFNNESFLQAEGASTLNRSEITRLNLKHSIFLDEETQDAESESKPFFFDDHLSKTNEASVDENGRAYIGLEHASDALLDWRKPLGLTDIWRVEEWEDLDRKSEFRGMLQILLCGSLEITGKELSGLRYLGPLRKIPNRDYVAHHSQQIDWAEGLAAWDIMARRGQSFINEVNHWLADENRLASGYRVKLSRYRNLLQDSLLMGMLDADQLDVNRSNISQEIDKLPQYERVLLHDIRRNIDVTPLDVGVGISQMLPVVVGALDPEIAIFSVEQPELHIHPRLQVELADLFIHESINNDRTFILETHSEHLLLRLLKRIREANTDCKRDLSNSEVDSEIVLSPDDVALYYVDCVGGETLARRIRLSEDGKFLDRWPKGGFFPERAREVLDAFC